MNDKKNRFLERCCPSVIDIGWCISCTSCSVFCCRLIVNECSRCACFCSTDFGDVLFYPWVVYKHVYWFIVVILISNSNRKVKLCMHSIIEMLREEFAKNHYLVAFSCIHKIKWRIIEKKYAMQVETFCERNYRSVDVQHKNLWFSCFRVYSPSWSRYISKKNVPLQTYLVVWLPHCLQIVIMF